MEACDWNVEGMQSCILELAANISATRKDFVIVSKMLWPTSVHYSAPRADIG